MEENAVEVFHHYGIHFPLLSWCKIPSLSRENNVVVSQFPFQDRLPRRPLALGKDRIIVPGFVRSARMLTFCDFAHSLPLGSVDRFFFSTQDKTQRHFSFL